MLCGPHCSQLPTMLNNIVTPDSGSRILFNIVDKLASVNNVGSTTLFNPVKQGAHNFYACNQEQVPAGRRFERRNIKIDEHQTDFLGGCRGMRTSQKIFCTPPRKFFDPT
jgi:hypothetical protein